MCWIWVAGPGVFTQKLQNFYPDAVVVSLDLAHQMLTQVKLPFAVNAAMQALPFADQTFDLIFANQVVHWADSLPLLFRELNRVMKPEGCLMFSTLGPDTMQELRWAFFEVDQHAHTHDFIDMHHYGDTLLGEHFLDPVMDSEILTLHYATLPDLLNGIKAQGVRNINQHRRQGLMGKQAWSAFQAAMLSLQTDNGKLPLTYEVIYGHAWKGVQRRLASGTETMVPIEQLFKSRI